MHEHWGSFCKQLRRLAAPTAACLLMSSAVPAQQGQYWDDPTEGRVRVLEHHAPQTVPGPVPPAPNSLEAIFAPGWEGKPLQFPQLANQLLNQHRPQSLDTPNMIGDFLGYTGSVSFTTTTMGSLETSNGLFDLPGSGRIPKVAENNSAIPRDRVYFAYNHFHNAYNARATVDPNDVDMNMDPLEPANFSKQFDQNRFTLGLEKTLFYGNMSLEFRMPLVTQIDYTIPGFNDPTVASSSFGTNDPTGNLSVILKQVFLDWYGPDSSGVFSGGFGLTFPTSEGAAVELGDAHFEVDDAGVHFSPYLTLLIDHRSGWFLQGFVEFDFSTDEINVRDRAAGNVGKVDIPDVINLDVGLGWWMYRFPTRRWFQGLAPIIEYHYTGQRQDFKSIAFQSIGPTASSNVIVGAFDSRRDTSNLTTGLHILLNKHMNARVAGVVPLQNAPDRQFDAEFVFQLDIVH